MALCHTNLPYLPSLLLPPLQDTWFSSQVVDEEALVEKEELEYQQYVLRVKQVAAPVPLGTKPAAQHSEPNNEIAEGGEDEDGEAEVQPEADAVLEEEEEQLEEANLEMPLNDQELALTPADAMLDESMDEEYMELMHTQFEDEIARALAEGDVLLQESP